MQTVITPKGRRRYAARQSMKDMLLQWAMRKNQQEQALKARELQLEDRKTRAEYELDKMELLGSITESQEGKPGSVYVDEIGKWYENTKPKVNTIKIGDKTAYEYGGKLFFNNPEDGWNTVKAGKSDPYGFAEGTVYKKKGNDTQVVQSPGGGGTYTMASQIDDTRQFWGAMMKSYLDPNGFGVLPQYKEDYKNAMKNMQRDLVAVKRGLVPSWMSEDFEKMTSLSDDKNEVKVVIPDEELSPELTDTKVSKRLLGKIPGIYDVNGVRFSWDGKIAIPYRKKIYTGKVPKQ